MFMQDKLREILEGLRNVDGLGNFFVMAERDKVPVRSLEQENNVGVHEALNREFTLLLTHDSRFREPAGSIVVENNGETVFPGVPFPEVGAKEVVSSSPSEAVHNFLVERFGLKLENNEATLLIGFNLKKNK